MTGRSRGNGNHVGLAPPDEPVRAEYERDIYSWTKEQARLIRDGRWDLVDRDNVAEEIESLGRTEFNRLESALRVLLLHMLKWDHQATRRSRSWAISIRQQRLDLEDVLADNPGLRPRVGEAISRAYRKARLQATKETGIKETRFPIDCPYSWREIQTRDFSR